MSNMPQRRRLLASLGCLALPVVLAGCPAMDDRQPVTGAVTVDGAPLELGAIHFVPLDTLAAASSQATVRDGRFTIPPDRGLRPGRYTVEVLAYRETGNTVDDPQVGERPELEELRFEETELEATVQEGERNHFEFALTIADK